MDRAKSNNSEMSLCEKSMLVVANIIRLSSFSVAQKTLRTTTTGKAGKDLSGPHDYSHVAPEKEPVVVHDQFPAARRSQERRSRAKSYLMTKPVGGNHSTTHVIHEERFHEVKPKTEESVDGLASDYIREIRKKLGCGL